ncbi:hypothetical protein [Streptomyces sp. NPDC050548]|uniref:hypothetical protein n=1 Tax=Streptomyces sp. NPDC050548 TaxID=3365629 RepID=UPI00378F62B0
MAARFTLFGIKGLKVPDVAQLVAEALSVQLARRESSYKGGEYFFHRGADEVEISVEEHVCDEEGFQAEPEFSEYAVLVYLNYSRLDMEERLLTVKGLDLLRSESI